MTEFRVGDKVKRVKFCDASLCDKDKDGMLNHHGMKIGDTGTIKEIYCSDGLYLEEFGYDHAIECFVLVKRGRKKKSIKMLAILKSCNNLKLIDKISDVNEDATVYKLVPYRQVEKKTVMKVTNLVKTKPIKKKRR